MLWILIVISICTSNFKISNKYVTSTIGYLVKSFSGSDITFKKIEINTLKQVSLFGLEVRDKYKNIMLTSKKVDLDVNIFKKRKINSMILNDFKIFLNLSDEGNNLKVNWVEKDRGDSPLPDIGTMSLNNGKLLYKDTRYKSPILKELEIEEGKVVLNHSENEIKIEFKNKKESAKISINKEQEVVLSFKGEDMEFKNEYLQYIKASDFVKIIDGKVTLDLIIFLEKQELEGFLKLEGKAHVEEIIPEFQNVKIDLHFKKEKINGIIEGNLENINIKSKLMVDLLSKEVKLDFSFPNIVKAKNLSNILKVVKDFKIDMEGDFLFENVQVLYDFSKLNVKGNIKGSRAKLFNNNFKQINIDLFINEFISFKNLDIIFDNFSLSVRTNKDTLNILSIGDFEFISNMYKLPYTKGGFKLESKGTERFNNLDFKLFFYEFESHVNIKDLNGKLIIQDNIFSINLYEKDIIDINFQKNLLNNNIIFNMHFKNFILKNFFQVKGNFCLKLDNQLNVKENLSNLDFLKIDNTNFLYNDFKIRTKGIDDLININIGPTKLSIKNNNFAFDKISIKLLTGIKNHEYKIIGNVKNSSISIREKTNLLGDLFFNLMIYDKKIYLENLSCKKFKLVSFWDFVNIDKSYIDFKMNDFLMPYSIKLNKFTLHVKSDKANLEIDFKGNLFYKKIEIPIEGFIYYKDNVFDINNIAIGNNDLKGKLDLKKDEIDIIFRAIDTGTLKIKDFAFNFLGNVYIYGSIKEIKSYSDFNLKNIKYMNYNIPSLQGTFSFKSGKLCLGDLLISSNYFYFFLKPIGFIDFSKNIVSLDIFNDDIKLKDITDDLKGSIFIDISIKGDVLNPNYDINFGSRSLTYKSLKLDDANIILKGNFYNMELLDSYIKIDNDNLLISGIVDFKNKIYNINMSTKKINIGFLDLFYNFEKCSGFANFDLKYSSNLLDGYLKIEDGTFETNLSKIDDNFNIPIHFEKVNWNMEIISNRIKINSFQSNFNEGIFECFGYVVLSNKKIDYSLGFNLRDTVLELGKDVHCKLSSDLQLTDGLLKGKIVVKSGKINDIPKFKISDSKNRRIFDLDLQIFIHQGFEVSLLNFLNLESLQTYIEGDLVLKYFESLSLTGFIKADRGVIDFNQNLFKISNAKLSFDEDKKAPYLQLSSNTKVLNEIINLDLEGFLDSQQVKILDSTIYSSHASEKDDKIFKISLWTDTVLSLDEILFLIASSNDVNQVENSFQSGKFISEQVSKVFLLNPLSKGIKNFLGIYQFKINTNLFAKDNSVKNNLLNGTEIELTTNIYKNRLFGTFSFKLSESDVNQVENVSLKLSTRNQWMLDIAIYKITKEKLVGFGLSKKFNFKYQNISAGFLILSLNEKILNKNNLKINLEVNLKF